MNRYDVAKDFQGGFRTRRTATKFIVMHHAAGLYRQATGIEDVRAVAKFHTDPAPKGRGWPGIGYHIALAEEVNGGAIARYDLSDLELQRAHILDRNHECVGVSALTNFTGLPEQKWIVALAEVIRELRQRYPAAQVVGHGEIAVPAGRTACPGPRWLEWKPELLALVAGGAVAPSADQLTFRAPARIPAAMFRAVLLDYRSPCAAIADELYSIIVRSGIDPAISLAFFAHESTFGTAGISAEIKNWGNVRTPFKPERAVGVHPRNFAIYPSWQIAVEDWCDRINGRYIQERGLDTVDKAIPVYAPSSDGNTPAVYIAKVRDLVARWRTGTVQRGTVRPYRVTADELNVRQGQGATFPSAAVMRRGDIFIGDTVEVGEDVAGDPRWAHRADGVGFSSLRFLEAL